MKVLVTGSEGYIGTILSQDLIQAGFEVTGLDTGFYRRAWLYDGVERLPALIVKDIRLVEPEDLRGFEAVVHLAELSNDPIGQINPETTFEINNRGTVRLAQIAKQAGVRRFVYFSSCAVYGAAEQVCDETSPVNPLTPYAKCKVLNEQALHKLADDNFSPVILRFATVFGASPRMRFDSVINNLAGRAWTEKHIKMESNGGAWRPFIHLRDIGSAVAAILKAPLTKVHRQIFNVGSTNANYQIREVAFLIAQVFPQAKVTLNEKVVDQRDYRANFEKIHRIFPDFACKWDVSRGLSELVQIFKDIQLTLDNFESRDYTRLKQVRYLLETGQVDSRLFWKTT